MKRVKAMEILELNILEAGKKMPPDVKTALELHIEAMKVLTAIRETAWYQAGYLLPGEDE